MSAVTDLALHAIRVLFGEDALALCTCLTTFGELSLSELIGRYAEGASAGPGSYGITVGYKQKEAAKLTESVMLILGLGIHHGWVKYTRSEAVAAADGGKSRSGTIRYQFVAEPVLKLLGTPRFARHASALFGPIGAEVILTLSSLGVATKGDLVANVVASSGQPEPDIARVVHLMLNREFLERVEVAVVEADAPSSAADADATAVYRIRYRRFHMDFRDKAIVKFATEKFDAETGILVEYMLGQGCFVGHARGFELSRSISIAELLGAPGVMEKGLTAEAIHLRMQNLTSDSVPSANLQVSGSRIEDLQYCINVGRIVETLRLKSAVAYVQSKFGRFSARITRLLIDTKSLEEKTIGDLLMIPAKDVRALLYRLSQHNIVRIQELCSKPDLNVQGTHYMWFLDLPVFKSEIVQQVCKAFLNVAAKLEAHRASRKSMSYFAVEDPTASATSERAEKGIPAVQAQLEETLSLFMDW